MFPASEEDLRVEPELDPREGSVRPSWEWLMEKDEVKSVGS